MTFQPIGTADAVLYFTPQDLKSRGIAAGDIAQEELMQLALNACRQAGRPVTGPLEVETYFSESGLLLFLHAAPPSRTVWRFDDFEHLLSACSALHSCEADGSLYAWKGQYWLLLSEADTRTEAVLSEFARQAQNRYIYGQLAEHGTLLLPEQTRSTLQKYFRIKNGS